MCRMRRDEIPETDDDERESMDETIRREIENYRDNMPDLVSRLDFFASLWELQDELTEEAPEWEAPETVTMHEALVTGQPVFTIRQPAIPLEPYRHAAEKIAALLSGSDDLDADVTKFLSEADLAAAIDEGVLKDILKDVDAFSETIAEAVGADDESSRLVIDFVLTAALTPFLAGAARTTLDALDDFEWNIWGSGECPVCGTPAAIGHITDAGDLEGDRRSLSCSLCRADWEFDRLRCVRCGSRKHAQLRYLFDENDPGHRVHVCDICKGYLKVTDERELGRLTSPLVEDVVTLIMDAVAVDRGYERLGVGVEEPEGEDTQSED